MADYGNDLDIMGVSCDSFDEATNKIIGRYSLSSSHLDKLRLIREWCHKYNIAFKINTVVNTFNY